ncbi:hypothetical protein Q4I28_003594 [Leishmania naiffi]|uniref:Transmembrane protein n=1 Tax=Leishmania naiffi TaxID=5678 RepID=A0AAW3BRT1_9TRYP
MAFLLLAFCIPSKPAAAAVRSFNGVPASNPSTVSHLGDIVPLTLYVRMKRQIRHAFISIVDEQLEVEEEAVVDDAETTAQAVAAVEMQRLNDLDLPLLGGTRGKHKDQVVHLLPPVSSPRFGINKATRIMANDTLREAGRSLQEDITLQQSDLAFRFSVGRRLHKESTWLPLAARKKYTNLLDTVLARRLHVLQAAQAADAAAGLQRDKEVAEDMGDTAAALQVQYLSRVIFYCGYRKDELKMTSFSVTAHYSPEVKPSVELRFIWSEHRAYNPNRAVTLCSAVAVLVSMIAVLAVFHPSSRSMLLFSQRIVAVRAHD